jgi:hypothetical protein
MDSVIGRSDDAKFVASCRVRHAISIVDPAPRSHRWTGLAFDRIMHDREEDQRPSRGAEHPEAMSTTETIDGGCGCGAVRYRLLCDPMIVHCCHCTWCQRETGTAFALNAMIEADRVELLCGEPEAIMTPSESGRGQQVWRCPKCRIAVWSNYGSNRDLVRFVRVGTLDEPARLPPDVHIFTRSKQPWVVLAETVPAVPVYYELDDVWPPEKRERFEQVRAKGKAIKAGDST